MSTLTRFISGSKIGDNARSARIVSNVIDFAEYYRVTGTKVQNADVINALKLDAGMVVLTAGFKVLTAESGTSTTQLGLGATADKFVGATDITTTTDFGDALAAPEYLTADAYVTMTIATNVSGGAATGKILVWALIANATGDY